jgi:hypothetical protein
MTPAGNSGLTARDQSTSPQRDVCLNDTADLSDHLREQQRPDPRRMPIVG